MFEEIRQLLFLKNLISFHLSPDIKYYMQNFWQTNI